MPVDFELLLPPRFMFNVIDFADFRHRSVIPHFKPIQHKFLSMPARSCLILRTENNNNEDCNSEPNSPTKTKKKVVFADDRGLALTTVKVMTEPSDCPPRLSDEFLASIIQGASAAVTQESKWELNFKQPASNYMEFRTKLQDKCVSLENCLIKDSDNSLMGTIKVKNLSFTKEVFVRCTFNNWDSFVDFPTSYVSNGFEGSGHDVFDTFTFEIHIPHSAEKQNKVEFVICFKCLGQEYWDNNNDKNYVVITTSFRKSQSKIKYTDICSAPFSSWTEFASWNHLENSLPYW